jgi:lysozyme
MVRTAAAVLVVSAGAFVDLTSEEGYTNEAVIPVKGDVPTYGFGMTKRQDGSPVRMGDRTTPVRAMRDSLAHIQKDEAVLRRCVKAPLYQGEWDLLVDHAYQYGPGKTCGSRIVAETNAGRYVGACEAYLDWKFVARYDCSTPGNKRCSGVWKRSLERNRKCLAAQGWPEEQERP